MEKGEIITLPVKGSKVAGGSMFFQVNYRSREYDIRAFEFQRTKRPQRLQCIVKEIDAHGDPVFMQDIAAIIPQIYTVGDTYEFRVKTDVITMGYYEVADNNGLMFRVYPGRRERLHVNEVVRCRVKSINRVRMDLELISEKNKGIPLYTPEQVLELDTSKGGMSRYILSLFRRIPELGEAREQLKAGNPLWVMTASDVVDRHITDWLNAAKGRLDRRAAILRAFDSICTNLLENSGYLRQCTPQERVEYQDRLNKIITHSSDYVAALEKIISREDQKYIDETLERLKLSGYLYRPEERMRVAMALFSLRKKSVSNYIDDIFDIIRDSHTNPRFMKLFSQAFIEMLDMYITNESRHIDVLTGSTERTAIQQMVKALSLRLLLSSSDSDQLRTLYRSKLYRYATLLATVNSEQLVRKSLSTLFNISTPLEFTWNDLGDINLLCSKVAVSHAKELTTDTLVFEGSTALMTLKGDAFTFTPLERAERLKYGVPSDLFAPRQIRVLLNDRPQEKLRKSRSDIGEFKRLWKEVEHNLLSGQAPVARPVLEGLTPDVGDKVQIVVLAPVPGARYDWSARIVGKEFKGEGIISPKQIIPYPIIPSIDSFRSPETGEPYVFDAIVEKRDDSGKMLFNMRGLIHDYLTDALATGDEWLAQVSMVAPDKYICISEGGFSLYLQRSEVSEELRLGDFIIVNIESIFSYGAIKASYVSRTDERFQLTSAFKCLLENYCDGATYEEDEEENIDDVISDTLEGQNGFIEDDQMRELIHLIDREGMLRKDHIETYNYLALARIMALMLGDSALATYYANRMDLVETIRQFGDSGKIDDERLQRLLNENKDFVASYPEISNRLTQLRIINAIDKPYNDPWLWNEACNNPDDTTQQLANLVMSYNLLARSNVFEVRRTLHRKIYQLMDLKAQLPESHFVAEEDQFTELKTSMIYPAGNNMLPSEKEQVTELLKVISSFLNTRGGRLYIGVGDGGYATGLHNDFTYLNNRHENYDIASVKDKFDRTLRDAVHNRLGRIANSKLSTEFELVGDKWIYRVDVDPSPEVALVDGVAYERQGSSKWPIPAADLPEFRAQRERLA